MKFKYCRIQGKELAANTKTGKGIFKKLYKWVQDPEECRKLLTSIQLYVYLTRKGEEKE